MPGLPKTNARALAARVLAVRILEDILKRTRYDPPLVDDIAAEILKANIIAERTEPAPKMPPATGNEIRGKQYRQRIGKLEAKVAALQVELEKASAVAVKKQGFDGEYYRGMAERSRAKLAEIKRILAS